MTDFEILTKIFKNNDIPFEAYQFNENTIMLKFTTRNIALHFDNKKLVDIFTTIKN